MVKSSNQDLHFKSRDKFMLLKGKVMVVILEACFEKNFEPSFLLKNLQVFIQNQALVVSEDRFWDLQLQENKVIGLDITQSLEEPYATYLNGFANFDNVKAMRYFYKSISEKYNTKVRFCGCDYLTNNMYCMYDEFQNLHYGDLEPDDNGFDTFVTEGLLTE